MNPEPEIIEETSTEETPVKQKRCAPWRRNADGTYNNKPSDPEYFKKLLPSKYTLSCSVRILFKTYSEN